jgi:glycosyltransferase involved in cell wall biosynthesis
MMVSIIIPTKNEEAYLPLLLESIKRQGLSRRELEIIVADADSTDKTRDIARKYGCRVVEGRLPAYGRNIGARAAKGELLVFIDSDVILPENFLKPSLKEFIERDLDVAGALYTPIGVGKWFKDMIWYKMIAFFENGSIRKSQNGKKPYMMSCMFSTKKNHHKVGGFDETLNHGEDSIYARESVARGSNFGILESGGRILLSRRRFEKGGIPFLLKNLYYVAGMNLGKRFKIKEGKKNYWES